MRELTESPRFIEQSLHGCVIVAIARYDWQPRLPAGCSGFDPGHQTAFLFRLRAAFRNFAIDELS
jgi:hypothetical protein